MLLDYARLTGDPRALAAGLRTLDYMKRFCVPRGAQVWEVPLHTPDSWPRPTWCGPTCAATS